MYGLDLFSGIGGITKALEGYVTPVAYCENDRYAQGVLLSRQSSGDLPTAPIWDDVRTLRASMLPTVDIIYGGFPCQDISVAGRNAGLAGERTGLFFQIIRLAGEIRPRFIFLENVPAIRNRGADLVVKELARLGFDCRWVTLSAEEIGANHKRQRWFLLAFAASGERHARTQKPGKFQTLSKGKECANDYLDGSGAYVAHTHEQGLQGRERRFLQKRASQRTARTSSARLESSKRNGLEKSRNKTISEKWQETDPTPDTDWWLVEPNVGRVAHGVPFRVDRLRALGNAVVPAQAREAFERLMGLK